MNKTKIQEAYYFFCYDSSPSHVFFQHERSDFSTRALESEEISRYLTSIIAIFQLNYRDVFLTSSEQFDERLRTSLNIRVLQRQFMVVKLKEKVGRFLGC